MASLSRRNSHRDANAWPGWVDALSSLVMVVIFLLMVFVVAQFYLASALTGRDEQLVTLNRKVAEMNDLLALEREANADLRVNITQLSTELQTSVATRDDMALAMGQLREDRDRTTRTLEELQRNVRVDRESFELKLKEILSLQNDIKALREARQKLEGDLAAAVAATTLTEQQRQALLTELGTTRDRAKALESQLAESGEKTMLVQKEIDQRDIRIKELLTSLAGEQAETGRSRQQVDMLNQQLLALREQLARIATVLEASEKASAEQKVQIAELGSRLNQALAAKVQDLSRYRSEFFGRVREALGTRPDVRVVGDRFVFQSELLFPSGSATLEEAGKQRLADLARTLIEVGKAIPPDISWVLRVDGHTDVRPVRLQFPSNWELSSARAISVVKYLIDQGIPAERLAAAGFGEFQPLDNGGTEEAMARNRRIEIKLDQR
ncbi:peptidoglycan -binding protein [Azospirillum doebereinerae]|uniref:Peptidoglycan-binding protein n=1 Tax=Azospirillum doebereinerae TaxID=92933 RepID=A0A3S0WLM6_9PROT|nr:peptidoglycan -binding protein [Azospirillum doebereinerae]MCG5240378.1 peptidoglycan -binding protein [Azospirillum doebereinerae]RUQ70247.1 peptidoglycan -binding protein [Azospirillum doebereinerae]